MPLSVSTPSFLPSGRKQTLINSCDDLPTNLLLVSEKHDQGVDAGQVVAHARVSAAVEESSAVLIETGVGASSTPFPRPPPQQNTLCSLALINLC